MEKIRHWEIMLRLAPIILSETGTDAIIEIGMGRSTRDFAELRKEHPFELHSCDIVERKPKLFDEHHRYIMKSEEFIHELTDDVLDRTGLVFIDGEHHYEVIKMEIEFFLDRLNPNRYIFCHDMFPKNETEIGREPIRPSAAWTGDVWKYRLELEKRKDVDVFTWPITAACTGLTMIRKKDLNGPIYRR